MPDLAAVYDPLGIADSESVHNRIAMALCGNDVYRVASHTSRTFVALNALKPFSYGQDQPYCNRDGALFIDGALFGDMPFDEVVRILKTGDLASVRRLNGQFNAVVFHPESNAVTIVTDRLGTRPLYHAKVGDRHAVSSEIKGIRAALNCAFPVSPIGLLELFAFGHNIDNRTVLDDITVLPPGSIITIDPRGIRHVPYYEFGYSDTNNSLSIREWGESISACLKSVVPRYLAGSSRKAMFLSGGLDSRIVAGAVGSASERVHAYTFGDVGRREVKIAREIADRVNCPHRVLTYPRGYLSQVIRDVVRRTECATPFYHTTSVIFHDLIASESDVILVGFGGPLSGSQLWREAFSASPQTGITSAILKKKLCASRQQIETVFQRNFFRRYWPDLIDAFNYSVSTIDEKHGADLVDVWGIRNRQRRFTFSAPKVDRERFEVVAPLLDNDFVDLMATLPAQARWRQLAYRQAIVDGFPEIRNVPWAKTGRPVPGGRVTFWIEEMMRRGSRATREVMSKLPIGAQARPDKYRDVASDFRNDGRLFTDYLYPHLSDGALPDDIFNPQGIRLLADAHMNGQDHTHLLGAILTVAEFLGSAATQKSSPTGSA